MASPSHYAVTAFWGGFYLRAPVRLMMSEIRNFWARSNYCKNQNSYASNIMHEWSAVELRLLFYVCVCILREMIPQDRREHSFVLHQSSKAFLLSVVVCH